MNVNYEPKSLDGFEQMKERVAKAAASGETPMHKPQALAPDVLQGHEETMLQAGVSPRKLQSMKDYANKIVRQNPKIKESKLMAKIAKQYNVELK